MAVRGRTPRCLSVSFEDRAATRWALPGIQGAIGRDRGGISARSGIRNGLHPHRIHRGYRGSGMRHAAGRHHSGRRHWPAIAPRGDHPDHHSPVLPTGKAVGRFGQITDSIGVVPAPPRFGGSAPRVAGPSMYRIAAVVDCWPQGHRSGAALTTPDPDDIAGVQLGNCAADDCRRGWRWTALISRVSGLLRDIGCDLLWCAFHPGLPCHIPMECRQVGPVAKALCE